MQICLREGDFLEDLEKCCKTRIWTRKSALIQPRTSLGKRKGVPFPPSQRPPAAAGPRGLRADLAERPEGEVAGLRRVQRAGAEGAQREAQQPVHPRGLARTPSLFPRLVLGWINADFRVQIRIFQHISSSTRKSSSREQICKILQKKFTEFCKIFDNF